MRSGNYNAMDRKIDAYLGTRNLRPGPPARLINKILEGADNTDPTEAQRINFSSFSTKIGRNIPWNELSGVKISVYGSEPAFFLEFLNSKLLILKIPPELPLYYFGSLIAKGLGVKTPNCRIVEYKDPEFPIMMDNLERASHADIGINNKIIHEVKTRPFVLLYEYIPCLSLFELGENRSHILLRDKNFKSRELMINIGKILGLDIFLNNSKRLPFVWLNNGDPNNIVFKVIMNLLTPGTNFKDNKIIEIFIEDVYCVDTFPCVLDPNDKVMLRNLGDYLNSLGEFFKIMCYDFKSVCIYGKDIESFQFKSFDKLKAMFKNSTNYNLSPENLFHITMGILIMINTILDIDMESFEKLIKYCSKDAISQDWADSFKQYSQTIKTEYFVHIMDFFKKIKEDNDQIFSWIDEITMGFYQTKPQDDILRILKRHKKYRYDYEELKKKKEDEESSNITKSKSRKKKGEDEKTEKTEKSGGSKDLDNKAYILERDGFGPVGPQHKGKKNIRDFFNFNKNDNVIFKNDVHNGVYDIADITGDMIMGMKDRVYKEIYEKPPIPTDMDDDIEKKNKNKNDNIPKNEFKPSKNDYDPDHKVYTIEQLTAKIKNQEFNEIVNKKEDFNKEEFDYIKKKIDKVDPDFQKRMAREKEEEAEKNRRLKENEEMGFNNIPPQGRSGKNTEENNSLSKSKASKVSKSGSGSGSGSGNGSSSEKPKETEESKVKVTEQSKKSKQSKQSQKSKKSKKSSKKESDDEEEEEEEDESDA